MSDGIKIDEKNEKRFIAYALHRAKQFGGMFDASEFMTHLLDLYAWNNDIAEPQQKETVQ